MTHGYAGLFKQPKLNKNHICTFYCITNLKKDTLYIIILTPEAYTDIYEICKNVSYKNIYFLPIAIDVLFLSSLFNLYMSLKNIKSNIFWIYPDNTEFQTSVEFEEGHLKFPSYVDEENTVKFEFLLSNKDDRKFYDIIAFIENESIYFCQYLDNEKIENLYNSNYFDKIHMGYRSTIYGGLNYPEVIKLHNKYHNRLIVHSFTSEEEFKFCTEMNRISVGEVRYNDFI